MLYCRPVQNLLSNCLALVLPALSLRLPYREIPRFIKVVSWKSLVEKNIKIIINQGLTPQAPSWITHCTRTSVWWSQHSCHSTHSTLFYSNRLFELKVFAHYPQLITPLISKTVFSLPSAAIFCSSLESSKEAR